MNGPETAMVAWTVVNGAAAVVIWRRTGMDFEEAFMAPTMGTIMFLVLLPTALKHIVLSYYRKVTVHE